MNTKLFGQFLLEKGYVTREQLLHGLSEQRVSTRTLGDLAVATGMLSLQDVDAIHLRQHTRNEPFSQAAVQLGLLTEEQLAQLLHPQSAERLLLGQILLAFGYLTEKTLYEALAAHVTERDVDDSELLQHFRQSELREVGAVCVSVMRSVFKKTLQAPVSFQSIPAVKAVSAGQFVWSQALDHGPRRFELAVQFSDAEAVAVAQAVLGIPVESFDELARDSVNEFLNILTGHVCGNLDRSQGSVSACPPVCHRPEEYLAEATPDIALLCTSDELQFTYFLAKPRVPIRAVGHQWTATTKVARAG